MTFGVSLVTPRFMTLMSGDILGEKPNLIVLPIYDQVTSLERSKPRVRRT